VKRYSKYSPETLARFWFTGRIKRPGIVPKIVGYLVDNEEKVGVAHAPPKRMTEVAAIKELTGRLDGSEIMRFHHPEAWLRVFCSRAYLSMLGRKLTKGDELAANYKQTERERRQRDRTYIKESQKWLEEHKTNPGLAPKGPEHDRLDKIVNELEAAALVDMQIEGIADYIEIVTAQEAKGFDPSMTAAAWVREGQIRAEVRRIEFEAEVVAAKAKAEEEAKAAQDEITAAARERIAAKKAETEKAGAA